MPDIHPLLMNVLRDPADRHARRVYADWLQEQDDPAARERGEFIALSLDVEGASPAEFRIAALYPRFPEWEARWQDAAPGATLAGCLWAASSLRRLSALWNLRHAEWDPTGQPCGCWRGGFLYRAVLTRAAFLEHAAALFAAHPITEVRLADAEPVRIHVPPHAATYALYGNPHEPESPYKIGPELLAEVDAPDVDFDLGVAAKEHESLDHMRKAVADAALRLGLKWAGVSRG